MDNILGALEVLSAQTVTFIMQDECNEENNSLYIANLGSSRYEMFLSKNVF